MDEKHIQVKSRNVVQCPNEVANEGSGLPRRDKLVLSECLEWVDLAQISRRGRFGPSKGRGENYLTICIYNYLRDMKAAIEGGVGLPPFGEVWLKHYHFLAKDEIRSKSVACWTTLPLSLTYLFSIT
jgi:hypothetical protein